MRKFNKPQEQEQVQFSYGPPRLPKGAYAAGYIRQSTKNQAESKFESADMQLEDVYRIALRLGIENADYVIIYIENKGKDGKLKNASGKLRIDQREGLQALVERIESGEVKVVIVWREDRLFRDETLIQPTVFADICKRNNCLIATPYYTYDFNKNRFDLQLFMQKAVEAANFLKDYVAQQLHGGRKRVALRGEYDGRAVAFGYLYKKREERERVERKPIVYQPTADIILKLFGRCHELRNNTALLYREIVAMPYLFPEYPEEIKREYITKNFATQVPGGYTIARPTLFQLLTNTMYIGHWEWEGVIVRKYNHDPIVPEGLFYSVYNALAATDIEGNPNGKKVVKYTHYHHWGTRPRNAVLEDLLTSPLGTTRVDKGRSSGDAYSVYLSRSENPLGACVLAINVEELDNIVFNRLLEVSHDMYLGDNILARFQEQQQKNTSALVSVDDQRKTIVEQIATCEANLNLPPSVLSQKRRLENALRLKDLEEILAALDTKQNKAEEITAEDVEEYTSIIESISRWWKKAELAKKQKLVSILTTSITITTISPKWLLFSINWYGPYGGEDVAYIYRSWPSHVLWTDEEKQKLREMYVTASRQELMEAFPTRTLHNIVRIGSSLGLNRLPQAHDHLPEHETLADIQTRNELSLTEMPQGRYWVRWLTSATSLALS